MADHKAINGTRDSMNDRRMEILDAAEALVRERGAGHLTLDAVAARVGYSKGGLIHRFPNKVALIEAMIDRVVDEVDSEHRALRAETDGRANADLLAVIERERRMPEADADLRRGLLVAAAEQPDLLARPRAYVAERFRTVREQADDPVWATLLLFAAEAPGLFELMGLYELPADERRALFDRLAALAAGDADDEETDA
ncbi:hypothetical protein CCR85_00975 [Rhodothalassium salexigens]|nr:hypothetical protein [Rhodothalassium salexigens]